jgi:sugar O-acyltransferase (sialic acid O-acetyltransferase NeuD family)
MKKKIILYGSGGHSNSEIDVINATKKFKIELILDDEPTKKKILHTNIEKSSVFINQNKISKNIHISFASIYNLNNRLKIYEKLKAKKIYKFPNIISPISYISENSNLSEGIIIMHGVIINSNVQLDENVVINTGSILEHDVKVCKNSHISTRVTLNGGVSIGKNCFVGSGSVIRENVKIPDNTFIKMGSIVKK